MPVSIDIQVNSEVVRRIHVARIEGTSTAENSVNTYSVISYTDPADLKSNREPDYVEYLAATHFTHRYGDGVEKLAEYALQVIQDLEGGESV